jgi:YGGT family
VVFTLQEVATGAVPARLSNWSQNRPSSARPHFEPVLEEVAQVTYQREVVETVDPAPGHVHATTTEVSSYRPSPLGVLRRWIIFVFGLIQLLIVVRIIFLLLAAREGNSIVSFIYSASEIFVAPFRGILRIDEVQAGATALDIGAIVALVGWFIIELIVLALVRVFRPSATA